jgi:hypothetical protein
MSFGEGRNNATGIVPPKFPRTPPTQTVPTKKNGILTDAVSACLLADDFSLR